MNPGGQTALLVSFTNCVCKKVECFSNTLPASCEV